MRKHILAALLSVGLAGAANAAVVTGNATGGSAVANGGVYQFLNPAPGFTVGIDNQQSNNLFAFNEKQGVTLLSNLATTIGGTILAGTRVNSHYVFFDPGPSGQMIGNVSFDGAILGLLTTRTSMVNTDALLGKTGVTYLSDGRRGLEAGDFATFSGNALNVDFTASTPGDYIRVISAAAVPEPASWAMLIAGFGAIGGAMRRRARITITYA